MALPESNARLLHALGFAVKSRENRRLDVGPSSSVERAIEVAELLNTVDVSDTDTLVAAVLRAVMADGSAKAAEIERVFGTTVRALVEVLTPPHALTESARRDWLLRRLKSADHAASAIQLADIVVTLRHLPQVWTEGQRGLYLEWAQRARAVLAGTNTRLDIALGEALRLARTTRLTGPLRTAVPISAPEAAGPVPLSPEFLRELRLVRSALERAEARLGDVVDSVDAGLPKGPRHGSDLPVTRRARRYTGSTSRESAAPGVGSVTFRSKDPRTVFVSIDGGNEFLLSPVLADLLAVISSADKAGSDGFVAFQPLEAVVSAMTARGRRSSRRAVIVAISRLRERLAQRRHPPLLVETSVRHGVRFRLRV